MNTFPVIDRRTIAINVTVHQKDGKDSYGYGKFKVIAKHTLNDVPVAGVVCWIADRISELIHVPREYLCLKYDGKLLSAGMPIAKYRMRNYDTVQCYVARSLEELSVQPKIIPGLVLKGVCKNPSCLHFEKEVNHCLGIGIYCYTYISPPQFECIQILCKKTITAEKFGVYDCAWQVEHGDDAYSNDQKEWNHSRNTSYLRVEPFSKFLKKMGDYIVIKLQNNKWDNPKNLFFKMGDNCVICLDDMTIYDQELTVFKCGHVFHKGCAEDLKKTTNMCPSCRLYI